MAASKSKKKADDEAVGGASDTDTLSLDDIRNAKDRAKLNALMLEARSYQDEAALNQSLYNALKPTIEALLRKLNVKRAIKGEQWHAILMPGAKQLSAELLLENGVDIEVIDASKKQGKASWQIRGVKDKSEASGG